MNDADLDLMIANVRGESKFFDGDHVARDAPMNFNRVDALEQKHRVTLNPKFRRFLEKYGAGDFLYAWVYSFDPDSGWSLWRASEFLSGVGVTVLPFSDNGGGDYLAFKVTDGKCSERVYWLDHEQDYAITDSEYEDFNAWVAKCALKA
jgi:hypothetical protein